MREILYKGDSPVIVEDIEFNKKQIVKVNETQMKMLEANPFFMARKNDIFEVIGKEEKNKTLEPKDEECEEIEVEEKAGENRRGRKRKNGDTDK